MKARWHLLTGEYEPQIGGIARFTRALAEAMASRAQNVHVWVPGGGIASPGVTVHALADRFGRAARAQLHSDISPDDIVILQYTPNALGMRGANVPFCWWVARTRGRHPDFRVVFHEPFFYFGLQRPGRNALAIVQRAMAALLLSGARAAYVSSASWLPFLRPYALGRRLEWTTLPISVGRVASPPPDAVARVRARQRLAPDEHLVGHLGTYAGELRPHLAAAIRALLASGARVHVMCMGRGSTAFVAETFPREPRVSATGELPEADLASHVCACDLLIAPFREGATARRTSLIGALALGAPVVTTDGHLTEEFWRDDGAVTLVPAGDAAAMAAACSRLLDGGAERRALGTRAATVYEKRFSPEALLDAIGVA